MPARAEKMARRSDFDQYSPSGYRSLAHSRSGERHEVVLYFGIIDILQDYDISKKLEHAYKSLQVDSTSISAVDPKLYSKRFRDFIGRIFVEDRWYLITCWDEKYEGSWLNLESPIPYESKSWERHSRISIWRDQGIHSRESNSWVLTRHFIIGYFSSNQLLLWLSLILQL